MRFKNFLTEYTIHKWDASPGTDIGKLIVLLNEHCSNGLTSVKNDTLLYRGDTNFDDDPYVVIDTSESERTSKDTNNIYQLMLETSEHLKYVPKRSKSLICSSSLNGAEIYVNGNVTSIFVVIPYDGTKIASIENTPDVINFVPDSVFNPHKLCFDQISRSIRNVFYDSAFNTVQKFTSSEQCDNLLSGISSERFVEMMHSQLKLGDIKDAYLEKLSVLDSNKRFTGFSNLLCTTNSVPIELTTNGNRLNKNVECWFSGKAIMISIFNFKIILETMIKNKQPVNDTLYRRIENRVRQS